MRAAVDSDRAERIARHIIDLQTQAAGLAIVAKAVRTEDPDNSRWLLENAKRIARAGSSTFSPNPRAFEGIAKVVAAYDPDDAESIIIGAFAESGHRDPALQSIARVVADHDPDRAERIVQAMADPAIRCNALLTLVRLARDAG